MEHNAPHATIEINPAEVPDLLTAHAGRIATIGGVTDTIENLMVLCPKPLHGDEVSLEAKNEFMVKIASREKWVIDEAFKPVFERISDKLGMVRNFTFENKHYDHKRVLKTETSDTGRVINAPIPETVQVLRPKSTVDNVLVKPNNYQTPVREFHRNVYYGQQPKVLAVAAKKRPHAQATELIENPIIDENESVVIPPLKSQPVIVPEFTVAEIVVNHPNDSKPIAELANGAPEKLNLEIETKAEASDLICIELPTPIAIISHSEIGIKPQADYDTVPETNFEHNEDAVVIIDNFITLLQPLEAIDSALTDDTVSYNVESTAPQLSTNVIEALTAADNETVTASLPLLLEITAIMSELKDVSDIELHAAIIERLTTCMQELVVLLHLDYEADEIADFVDRIVQQQSRLFYEDPEKVRSHGLNSLGQQMIIMDNKTTKARSALVGMIALIKLPNRRQLLTF